MNNWKSYITIEWMLTLPEVKQLFWVPAGPAEHHHEKRAKTHTELVMKRANILTHGDPLAILAAGLHDIGKAYTDKDKWPSHIDHHTLSEGMALLRCLEMDVAYEETNFVRVLCHYHHSMHEAKNLQNKTWRKLFGKLNWDDYYVELFILVCQADHEGREGDIPPYPEADIARKKFLELKEETKSK